MRDIVIHDYDSTDIPVIWNVVRGDLPRLRKTIDILLREAGAKQEISDR